MTSALLILGLTATALLAYTLRVVLRGTARSDRIDSVGGSALLSKRLVEMGYWAVNPIARGCVAARITPDMITWASLALGLAAGIAIGLGNLGGGALLALGSTVFDILDGKVARITKTGSDSGEVLDAAVDRYTEFFYLAGCIVYYHDVFPLELAALAALQACFMVSYSTAKAEAMKIDPPKGSMRRHERAVYLITGTALSVMTAPSMNPLPRYPSVHAAPLAAALIIVAVFGNISAVRRLALTARALRARDRDSRTPEA